MAADCITLSQSLQAWNCSRRLLYVSQHFSGKDSDAAAIHRYVNFYQSHKRGEDSDAAMHGYGKSRRSL